jgi:hypothetical protein
MLIKPLGARSMIATDPLTSATMQLQALAKRQNMSVDEMVETARDADFPTVTQQRIIKLAEKLESLTK